jgi:hypothetical protein
MNSFTIMPPPTRPPLPCRKSWVEIDGPGHTIIDQSKIPIAPPYGGALAVTPIRALTPGDQAPEPQSAGLRGGGEVVGGTTASIATRPLDLGLRAQIRTAFQLLADRVLSLMGLVAAGREADVSFTRTFPLRRCPNAKRIPTMTG